MKTIVVFLFVVFGFINLQAQDTASNASSDNKIYTIVQQQPKFPGDINKYLSDNIVYPDEAKKNNIQGTVYEKFVVEKDGSISAVTVMRGLPGGKSLENEAIRVVSAMPKWAPGMQNGKPVRVQYMVPIHFILKDNNSLDQKKN